jgi:pimeloyl-ACP methyl ester carboxylesterase
MRSQLFSRPASALFLLLNKNLSHFGAVALILTIALGALVSQAFVSQIAYAQRPEAGDGPPPEERVVTTKDLVHVHFQYFAPKDTPAGKNTVPVILLHGQGGSSADMAPLARHLQKLGHAVFVPDLRGHGKSVRRVGAGGAEAELHADSMPNEQYVYMVNFDMEAIKKHILELNNDGKVNIELLTIVGCEMSTIVALDWTLMDWSWPSLPSIKQGQDVKALVLISPLGKFKGLSSERAPASPVFRKPFSILLIGGAKDKEYCGKLYDQLVKHHPLPPPELAKTQQSLYYIDLKTSLQGAKLFDPSLDVHTAVGEFIDRRLVKKASDFPWNKRINPLLGE